MHDDFTVHGGAVVDFLSAQLESPGLGPFCLQFATSSCPCVSFLWDFQFLKQYKNMLQRLTGMSKLSLEYL